MKGEGLCENGLFCLWTSVHEKHREKNYRHLVSTVNMQIYSKPPQSLFGSPVLFSSVLDVTETKAVHPGLDTSTHSTSV